MKENKPKYLIPYPYTMTIATLSFINGILILLNLTPDNYVHFLRYIGFTFVLGIAQLNGLLNLPNAPAWIFPKGSAYLQDKGVKYKHLIGEDILFIPNCASLFYWFMYLTHNIPDFLNSKYFIMSVLATFIIIEAIMYQRAGKGTQVLMIAYTLIPIITLLIVDFDFKTINITHATLSLAFIALINCCWELFNAHRNHWIYNHKSDVFGNKGWIKSGKLHIGIFIQYFISGFIVCYFTWIYFSIF